MTNPTPEDILANLAANPHPKQTHLEMAGGFAYITIDTHKIAYDGERWFVCGQQITPRFSMNSLHQEIDRVFVLARKIKDHVLGTDTKEQTTMTAEQLHNILSNHPYPDANNLTQVTSELMYFNVDGLWIGYDKGIWKAELHLKQYPITPNFPPLGELTVRDVHAEISRVVKIGKSLHADTRAVATETVSTEQTFVSIDRYRELEAELKTMTTSRDATQERVEALQQLLPLFCLGVNAPTDKAREKIDRLKSKADRAGLLSVVCRRLCGDENASIETVHAAIDRCHDESTTLDFIGERLGMNPDGSDVTHLGEIRSLVTQLVKSLGEKTVEVAKLQEGLTNYKAQVEGLTKRVEQLAFERDAERVGNKWLSETIEDLKRTTVKLPGEHTLRRLFNRHNTPDKYDDGTTIPTIERFLLIIENLCRNADCLERRFEELNAISTRVDTESEDAHALLDEMGIPRWTTVGNHNERYLSLSARIRSVFQTHTKV